MKCLALDPGYARAAYSLVRLRRQTSADHHLGLIESCMQRAQPGSQQHADFEFARYHVLEDLGQTGAAWQALVTANAEVHAYAAAGAACEFEGVRHFCEQVGTHPARIDTAQERGSRPIFILGLPRTCTTVLERMLANHSRVVSAGELTDLGRQLLRVGNTSRRLGRAILRAAIGARFCRSGPWLSGADGLAGRRQAVLHRQATRQLHVGRTDPRGAARGPNPASAA